MALKINLLEWREERRETRKKQFFATLGLGGVAGAAIALALYVNATGAVSHQESRNAYLNQQIALMDQKIKEIESLEKTRANLLARMQVIESLQSDRTASVKFFAEVVRSLPEGVTLTLLRQQGAQVTIEGLSESNGRVSTYMKNLEASRWFSDPQLVVIKASEVTPLRSNSFTLRVKSLTKEAPNPDGAEEEAEVLE